ncbi:MAG: succinate dehydrogenase assembly factor 2 [Candidatus Competibacterales bacterium]|nr:succinate dehydrogenase assembly factor 2 [Candidatus Competibacterales bacterium]
MAADPMSRLRWRCRRGTQELDRILSRFLADGYEALDSRGRANFERLLDCEDDHLQDWLILGKPTDGEFQPIVRAVRDASGL